MRRVLKLVLQIFTGANGRVSSKRVCGFIGWIVVLWVNIYCTLKHSEAPEITEVICIVSATLLGIGVTEPYFRSKGKIPNNESSDNQL